MENGKNVFPEEIEEYLSNIDLIAESVVIGRKHEDENTIVLTAIIYPQLDRFENPDNHENIEQQIKKQIALLNKKLPTYKQIREIKF